MELVKKLLKEVLVPKTYEAQLYCLFPFILVLPLAFGLLLLLFAGIFISDTAVSFGKINFSP